MWREVVFPVPPPHSSCFSWEPDPQFVYRSPEVFVLERDDARGLWRHPTTGRIVTDERYRRDPQWWRDWLRGLYW